MNTEGTGNQLTAVVAGLIGAGMVTYPLVFGPVEMWSVFVIGIGVLLIVVSAVVFFSDSTPQEDRIYNRGGRV